MAATCRGGCHFMFVEDFIGFDRKSATLLIKVRYFFFCEQKYKAYICFVMIKYYAFSDS